MNTKGICDGVCLVMLNNVFKIPSWRKVEYGRLDEIYAWFQKNFYRHLEITDLRLHGLMMIDERQMSDGTQNYAQRYTKYANSEDYKNDEQLPF